MRRIILEHERQVIMMFKRIFIVVLDSLGVGELPDAHIFNDEGANTFRNLVQAAGGINIPNMERLGIGYIVEHESIKKDYNNSYYSKMMELSNGKDTMTGHWEMMGLRVTKPFKTFTETGFPKELLNELSKRTGRNIIGNKSMSGTEIIKELGEEHLRTGDMIVYTSADSVLQIAAHEEVIPLDELYKICKIAREITLTEEWRVGRIIARPFIGDNKDNFKRTPNRHDYALNPFSETVLDKLKDNDYDVISVGKISDIFNASGITESNPIKSNAHGMDKTIEIASREFNGLCFTNLVDFDALYGHRRNAVGYRDSIEEFDGQLKELINSISEDDLLILTADHGNDPTYRGSDHTREYVPLLVYNKNLIGGQLDIRESFADLGATVAENFGIELPSIGESFLGELK